MAKLIISCDEKFPVFDLEVPEEGQTANCEVTEEFHREYLYFAIQYSKMQDQLRKIYENVKRRSFEQSSRINVKQGSLVDDECELDKAINAP